MSEAPLEPAVDTVPAPAEAEPAAPTPADMPAHRSDDGDTQETEEQRLEHVRKVRSENYKLRAKLKELEPLAKRAQEADEAAKSKEQKAEERALAAEAREKETLERYTRMEVAVQYGIPKEDIDFIGSGTREEMDSRAQRIAAKNAAASKATPPPTDRPVESLRPGATPEPPKPADDSYPSEWTPPWVRGGDKESSIFHGQ
jgi:hypothetical protein